MTKAEAKRAFKSNLKQRGFYISYNSYTFGDYDTCADFHIKNAKTKEIVASLMLHRFGYDELTSSFDSLLVTFDGVDSPLTDAIPKLFIEEDGFIYPTNELYNKNKKFFDREEIEPSMLYYISTLEVQEEFKGQGLGGLLVEFVLNFIVSPNENNLVLTYPYCLTTGFDLKELKRIVNFWHKNKFSPVYKDFPMFYLNTEGHKYDKGLFKKLNYNLPEGEVQPELNIDELHDALYNNALKMKKY